METAGDPLFSQAGGGTFTNTGTITKSGGRADLVGGVAFDNAGTLAVQAGTWYSDAGGRAAGRSWPPPDTLLTVYNHTLEAEVHPEGRGGGRSGNVAVGRHYSVTGDHVRNHGG